MAREGSLPMCSCTRVLFVRARMFGPGGSRSSTPTYNSRAISPTPNKQRHGPGVCRRPRAAHVSQWAGKRCFFFVAGVDAAIREKRELPNGRRRMVWVCGGIRSTCDLTTFGMCVMQYVVWVMGFWSQQKDRAGTDDRLIL
jgi:hypothetical protein